MGIREAYLMSRYMQDKQETHKPVAQIPIGKANADAMKQSTAYMDDKTKQALAYLEKIHSRIMEGKCKLLEFGHTHNSMMGPNGELVPSGEVNYWFRTFDIDHDPASKA